MFISALAGRAKLGPNTRPETTLSSTRTRPHLCHQAVQDTQEHRIFFQLRQEIGQRQAGLLARVPRPNIGGVDKLAFALNFMVGPIQ